MNANIVEAIRDRTAQQAHRVALTFLGDGPAPGRTGAQERALTYGDIDRRARAVAAALQRSAPPDGVMGSRALLLFAPGVDFVVGYLGCLYAGVIAVPAYTPHPAQLPNGLSRLLSIVKDADTAYVLTTGSLRPVSRALVTACREHWRSKVIEVDELPDELGRSWREPAIEPETIAFLQYTSGSTAKPKGVMVSHRNLTYNLTAIAGLAASTTEPQGVSWLPPYHDMGLIGGILEPLYAGFPCALMSPLYFLMQPSRWLEAMSRLRGSVSALPNFALDLCVRKVSDAVRNELDLSSWQLAINGAEPVRRASLERFSQKFGPCGFRPDVHKPVYGLAEATLLVSCSYDRKAPEWIEVDQRDLENGRLRRAAAGSEHRRVLISCGQSIPGQELVIVDPDRRTRCAPDEIGEIWLRGPSVASGYWRKPEETRETFQAIITGPPDESGPFLRTGDLGFLDHGSLYVVDRRKDLIIVAGRNFYPQDIELAAEEGHPMVRPGCCVAFAVDGADSESLVVVAEIEPPRGQRDHAEPLDISRVTRQISQHVTAVIGLEPYDLRLIRRGTLPKTSSGKVQRFRVRENYLSGKLVEVRDGRVKDPAE